MTTKSLSVVALCDDLGKALEIHKALRRSPGVRLFLVVSGKRAGESRRNLSLLARRAWAFKRHIARIVLLSVRGRLYHASNGLHDATTLAWIRQHAPDVGLHAAGVIYRRPLIECFRLGILNPHIGLLPAYRGRAVMEWSILHGDPTGVTTFFIDEGIDTGPDIVIREEVPVDGHLTIESAKAYLFSKDLEMFAKALRRLGKDTTPLVRQRPEDGKRYYVMSRLFRIAVEDLLDSRLH